MIGGDFGSLLVELHKGCVVQWPNRGLGKKESCADGSNKQNLCSDS